MPAILNLTREELGKYGVGRSPMPIATVLPSPSADSGRRRVHLAIFRPDASDTVRFTTNGAAVTDQSTAYTGPIDVEAGAVVRARNYRGAGLRPPSRELQLQVKDLIDDW